MESVDVDESFITSISGVVVVEGVGVGDGGGDGGGDVVVHGGGGDGGWESETG